MRLGGSVERPRVHGTFRAAPGSSFSPSAARTYFAVRMPGIVLGGLVPILGPALSWFWAAHALAFRSFTGHSPKIQFARKCAKRGG